jgi:DUF438 domain-containing protein
MSEEMNIFREICDTIDVRIGYADEHQISKFFNRSMYASGKRNESDLDKPIKDCHIEKTKAQIDFIYKAFEAGRREHFVIKRVIGKRKTVVQYFPLFLEGVFKGVFETITYPEELLEDFPFPGEFDLVKAGQNIEKK